MDNTVDFSRIPLKVPYLVARPMEIFDRYFILFPKAGARTSHQSSHELLCVSGSCGGW